MTLSRFCGERAFVAEVGAAGVLRWVIQFKDPGHSIGFQLAPAPNGDLMVGGVFDGTVRVQDRTLTADGVSDIFVMRLSLPDF